MNSFSLCHGIPMMKGKEIKVRWNAGFFENNMDSLGLIKVTLKNKNYKQFDLLSQILLFFFFPKFFLSVCIRNSLTETIHGTLIHLDVKKAYCCSKFTFCFNFPILKKSMLWGYVFFHLMHFHCLKNIRSVNNLN